MKKIDKYYFPYIDNLHISFGVEDFFKENCVYIDYYTNQIYRFINHKLEKINKDNVYDSGIVDIKESQKLFIRFLKENHILKEYIKAYYKGKIKSATSLFSDESFDLAYVFRFGLSKDINIMYNQKDKYSEYLKLFWIKIKKIK